MGDLIDFNKAKEKNEQKKKENRLRSEKNDKLIKKMKRYDAGKKSSLFYFGILLAITIIIVIFRYGYL